MEFSFTDEQEMIRDTAAGFLAGVSDSAAVRAAMTTETGYDESLWQRICGEMCWPGIHVPEQYGGLGLGYIELVATLEQMGRHLLCSPFYSTVCLGVNTLLVAGSEAQKAEYLPQLVEGGTATLAWTGGNGRWDADAVEATWTADGDGFAIDGGCRFVPDGHTAQWLLVAAREAGSEGASGISLFILPADTAGVSREWLPTMDQTRKQARVDFSGVRVGRDQLLGEPGRAWPQLATIIDLATVAVAAEQVGCAQQTLDATVAYALERVQFNRAIASFQAVKHKAADMMLRAESARSAVYYAACVAQEALDLSEAANELAANELAGGELAADLPEAASVAKAWCSDACFFNAGTGLQLHGGVGFTWEYDIQLHFKRAKSSETFLGNAAWHRERIARQLLDEDAAQQSPSRQPSDKEATQ